MKSFLSTVLLLVVLFTQAQGFKGDTWAQALKNKRAKVVLTNTDIVKFSETKAGQGWGICFDIMDDFAKYVKDTYDVTITYEYKPVANTSDFQMFLNAVKNSSGGVFGLGDITITESRKSTFDFAPPFFENIAVLVTGRDIPDLNSLDEIPQAFKGMKAVSQKATTHDKYLKQLQNKYRSFEMIYAKSSNAKTDMVVSSPNLFTYIDFPTYLELFSSRIPIKRHSVGDRKGEYLGFILPKGNDWTPIITTFFNANEGYTNSEAYKKILNDHLTMKVVRLIDLLSRK